MLPNFLIIGAMKAGTTSLHAYLSDHPQVFLPAEKELHFFVESRNWSKGLAWYAEQFAGAGGALAVGEASPSYTGASYYPGVPGRIADLLPDVRLVYLVRHPVERMRSMYLHQLALGKEQRPAVEAFVDDEPYLNTSRYRWQIDQYLQHFDREQLLVVTSESLRDDRTATLRRVFRFLGVDDSHRSPSMDAERHQTRNKRELTAVGTALRGRSVPAGLRRSLPAPVKRWMRARTTRPLQANPMADIPAELYDELCRRLRGDVAGLRELIGDDVDRWGLGR